MKLNIIHGPNLNFLGTREPDVYGRQTLAEINEKIESFAKERGHEISIFQSNSEGALIDYIQAAYSDQSDGIVINPAAYTHYSYAIHDALKGIPIPAIEVHLSAPFTRVKTSAKALLSPQLASAKYQVSVLTAI